MVEQEVPLISSLHNNNLAAIHGQKCLCGNSGIQVGGCESLMGSNPAELFLEGRHPQAADLPTMILATDPETASQPLWTHTSAPFVLGSATSTLQQETREESCPLVSQVKGPQTLVLAVDTEVACDPSPALLRHRLGAPRGKPAKLRLTVDFETALQLGSGPSQLQSTKQSCPPRVPAEDTPVCTPGDPKRALEVVPSPFQPQSARNPACLGTHLRTQQDHSQLNNLLQAHCLRT